MNLKNISIITLILIIVLCSIAWAKQYQGPIPTEFNQAPMLDKLVADKKLPPVAERLPEDPYVVEPNEEIGRYGGTIYSVATEINGWGEDVMLMDLMNSIVKPTPTATGTVPNFASKVESSDDMSTYTIYFRKGVKWSDGFPFTVDDVLFWYHDVLLNKELTPVISTKFKVNGKVMKMKKINDYTVEIKFAAPKPFFKNTLVHDSGSNYLLPKHFLKQFHPNYTPAEELKEKVEAAGFDYWYELFAAKNERLGQVPMVPRPTLTAYKLVKKTSNQRIYERNPYFWKVDTAGNQLPYIDRIKTVLASDREVLNGKILSGEVDFAGWNTDIRNYPMYKQYEKEGGFRTLLLDSGKSTDVAYMVNLTDKDLGLRKIFQDVRFRKALSLAINRQEINDTIYFGKAEPRQHTVLESSRYFEPEFATAYTDYDPTRAKTLLDEMGLKDIDGDGWRERADGQKLNFTIEYVDIETPKTPNVELVIEYWNEIGLDVDNKQISGELQSQRAPANMMDATIWHGGGTGDILWPIRPKMTVPIFPGWERTIWPEWGRWFQTDGQSGEEPPAKIKELRNWWEQMRKEPDKQKRIKLGKKILQTQAENLWAIGTVGKTPHPVIVDKDLHNVPQGGLWVWETLWFCSQDPEQIFFDEDEESSGNK